MSITDLMAKGYAKEAERARELELALEARLSAAGLPPSSKGDFEKAMPVTLQGWDTYELLLVQEGNLTPEERENIRRGRESLRIRERRKDLEVRIGKGESLPDPEYEGGEAVSPKYALLGQGALITWQAIRELGLSGDPHYRREREAANSAMGEVSRRRGDFRKLLESHQDPALAPLPKLRQTPAPPGFVETEIAIPRVAFSRPLTHSTVVRYHSEFGLIESRIFKDSYYDRGAGGYPGSNGSRVTEYRVSTSLLLELVDFRKYKGTAKQSVWRTFGDPKVIVGREKSSNAILDRLHCYRSFGSLEAARDYLDGKVESEFANQTLPVEFFSSGESYWFKFFARPI